VPVDGGDDTDREISSFEHRSLFDVDFDVAEHFFSAHDISVDTAGIAAECQERVAASAPAFVRLVEDLLVEAAGEEPGATQRAGKS
jgi:hypothetical protein